jgi:hypothetical protein
MLHVALVAGLHILHCRMSRPPRPAASRAVSAGHISASSRHLHTLTLTLHVAFCGPAYAVHYRLSRPPRPAASRRVPSRHICPHSRQQHQPICNLLIHWFRKQHSPTLLAVGCCCFGFKLMLQVALVAGCHRHHGQLPARKYLVATSAHTAGSSTSQDATYLSTGFENSTHPHFLP